MSKRTCGECRFFRITEAREHDSIGDCRVGKLMGVFKASTVACNAFSLYGDTHLPPADSRARRGSRGIGRNSATTLRFEVSSSALAELLGMNSPGQLKHELMSLLARRVGLPTRRIPDTMTGPITFQPDDTSLQAKEVPVEQFLSKGLSIRDNLRVLEQKINGHPNLSASRILDFQSQLTRVQGTVLTFVGEWTGVDEDGDGETSADAQQLLMDLARSADWKALILTPPRLADRWHAGIVVYGSGEDAVREPMEEFFRRLIIMRGALLDLVASIEGCRKFEPDQIDGLTNYIKRCFGSLTTYNLFFSDRGDYFSSK